MVQKGRKMTIYDLIKKHPSWGLKAECPLCGKTLSVDEDATHITCENQACITHTLARLNRWTNTLDLKGFGDAVLETINTLGVEHIADLYDKAVFMRLAHQEGFGQRSADKLWAELGRVKDVDLPKFVAGLNIKGVGEKDATKVLEHLKPVSIDDLNGISFEDCICDGIGESKAKLFADGVNALWDAEIAPLKSCVNIIVKQEKMKAPEGCGNANKLEGFSFCFTGAMVHKRAELEKMVIENGGEVKSVSKNLTFLVQADKNSQSTKSQKAKSLGVSVISEDDFLGMVDAASNN